jgi:hypothetical protein
MELVESAFSLDKDLFAKDRRLYRSRADLHLPLMVPTCPKAHPISPIVMIAHHFYICTPISIDCIRGSVPHCLLQKSAP